MSTARGHANIASRSGLTLALALIVIPLLAVISLQVYESSQRPRQLVGDRRLSAHTCEVIATAEGVKSAAQNAERFQRGFLLTGAPAYLASYQKELKICNAQLAQLRRLTSDNPEQQRRLPSLQVQVAVEEWIAERQHTVEVYTRDGPAAAQQLVRTRGSELGRARRSRCIFRGIQGRTLSTRKNSQNRTWRIWCGACSGRADSVHAGTS